MKTNNDERKGSLQDTDQKFRILILGAGFSKAAGFPLGSELWGEIRKWIRRLHDVRFHFDDALKKYIKYKRDCDGVEISEEKVDYEEFMGFLDVEHYLRLKGPDTWSDDGNEATVITKAAIGDILCELTPAVDKVPDIYKSFAERLRPQDIIITFNYDILLERALDAIKKPYRLFLERYKCQHYDFDFDEISRQEVIIYKMHGSIDWFDMTSYLGLVQEACQRGFTDCSQNDPVFDYMSDLGVRKLIDGAIHPKDPLKQICRVMRVEELYKKEIVLRATPCLLTPSTMKILYTSITKDFWYGIDTAGILNFGLAIIGYSLPPQDAYARQAVYNLVNNYQSQHWDKEILNKKKTPLVIVDHRKTDAEIAEFRERYRFVNWDRAKVCMDGLDHDSLDIIFSEV